ncbi:MAG: class I SAM-dependent methyltransferase [Planctomycetales bacterium]|nr:class I SAM-dependent methyltransferase [Planctomycetales bacterium]
MPNPLQVFAEANSVTLEIARSAFEHLLMAVKAHHLPASAHAQMHDYYDRMILAERYFLHHFAPYLMELDHTFQVKKERPRLLDLGCGVGTQAYLMGLRGASVYGIDFKPSRAAAAQAMKPWYTDSGGRDVEVTVDHGDAFQILDQLEPHSHDGAYTQFALAYMTPHERMLRLIDRVVRPGGRILFREFNAGNIYNRIYSKVDWLTPQAYQQIGQSLGWQLESQQYYWLFPKPLINHSVTGKLAISAEEYLARFRMFRPFTGSVTLVFRKN